MCKRTFSLNTLNRLFFQNMFYMYSLELILLFDVPQPGVFVGFGIFFLKAEFSPIQFPFERVNMDRLYTPVLKLS